MSSELLRLVDGISRDKAIDKEGMLADLEVAMASAVRKAYADAEEVTVTIDRMTGAVSAQRDGQALDMTTLGRIAAQTAKQVMIQKIREAERGSIMEEFSERRGQIVTGTVVRFEGGALIVNLGRTEGFLPKSEQIPGETHHPGERIRALILDVREAPNQVRIVLSRSHPDFIRRLFELEVPEVAERIIEIKALAREAGYRTKVAVSSIDSKVDAVGACVGVRGTRIKNIVDELGGEKIDIVRWNESSQILITNALRPAEIIETALCFELGRATVVVSEDQLSLAIGKRGQNVRLAARLTGWDVDILTPAEYNKGLDDLERILSGVEGIDEVFINKLAAMGVISLADLEEVGPEPLVQEFGIDAEAADRIVAVASAAAKQIAAEAQAAKEAAAREAAEKAALEAAGGQGAEEGGAGAAEAADAGVVEEAGSTSKPAGDASNEPPASASAIEATPAAVTVPQEPEADGQAGDTGVEPAESDDAGPDPQAQEPKGCSAGADPAPRG